MFKKNILLILFFVFASVFMLSSISFAVEKPNLKPLNLSPDQVITLDNEEAQKIEIKNPREFLESQNVEIPRNVKDVRVFIQTNDSEKKELTEQSPDSIETRSTLTVVPYQWFTATDWGNMLHEVTGSVGELTNSVTRSLAVMWSADVSVSATVVSAGLGYSVTSSYSVTGTQTVDTGGNYTVMQAYPTYSVTFFDVKNSSNTIIGGGESIKPRGVAFVVFQY
ncbi:MAG: hypothetical protein ACOX1X_02645 [Dethiobacteria bacterium]|jgi:hypothetical protein